MLQALIDAGTDLGYGVRVAAVETIAPELSGRRGRRRPAYPLVCRVAGRRADWDAALAQNIAAHAPASAGFMSCSTPSDPRAAHGRQHRALLPSFPGAHAVRDALAYGVRVTGATCHLVDAGVDTGPIIEQHAVAVRPDDTEIPPRAGSRCSNA